MKKTDKIFIVGEQGMLGSALVSLLKTKGFQAILGDFSEGVDLLGQESVRSFFEKHHPDYVFFARSDSQGIVANINYPADLIYNSLQIQNNLIHYSYEFAVKKLIFVGSSCGYPRDCPQPMKEEYLLSGKLEPTSEYYAIAKLAGMKMCQAYNKQYHTNFISVIPATIYGQKDDFDLEKGHVISSLLRKFHEAKINKDKNVVVWGTGAPRREFIYVDDLAEACSFLMQNYNDSEIINAGAGPDISIKELAYAIKDIVGFSGEIIFDISKPDGAFKKLLDSSKINRLGWKPKIGIKEGIKLTYDWYKKHDETKILEKVK